MNQYQRKNYDNKIIENWRIYKGSCEAIEKPLYGLCLPDEVGRIKTNTITRGSETYVEEYKYDLRGRLEKVLKDTSTKLSTSFSVVQEISYDFWGVVKG